VVFSGVLLAGSSVGQHVAIAKEAESLGYTSAWVTEVASADAVTVMAAASAATERITVATGIVSIFARSPYLMAMTLASLADVSGGRAGAGFGTSTPAIITGWQGIPFDRPLARTRAYVGLVRQFLAGERVKSEGLYSIRGASLRPAKHPVPIYLAALNTGMLELAGEIADGVILNFPTHDYATRAIAAIGRGLQRGGRSRSDIDIVANFRTGISDSFEDIATPLRRELISYFTAPVYQRVFREDGYDAEVDAVTSLWSSGDRAGALAAIPDAFTNAHGVIGTLDACRAKVRSFLDLGIDHAVLFPVVADGPEAAERSLATVRAFAPGA